MAGAEESSSSILGTDVGVMSDTGGKRSEIIEVRSGRICSADDVITSGVGESVALVIT